MLSVAVVGGCKTGVKIAGSTCTAAADCQAYASCGRNPDACTCVGGACWYDSTVASSTPEGCRGCHGTLVNAAPPKDTNGGTSTSLIGVGAHQTHLTGGQFSRPVPCSTCHQVPTNVEDVGHNDTPLPAEVIWADLAAPRGNVVSEWNHDSQTCTTYCHGAFPSGAAAGSNMNPMWTAVDGTQAACGTCHGMPPAGTHPQIATCEQCHSQTAGPNQTIIDPTLHVNGIVEVTGGSACTSCHGDATRTDGTGEAPPKALNGDTATTSLGVGAHQAHLHDGVVRLALPCSECHIHPASVDAPGHLDSPLPAEVTFGTLATTGNVTPVWDRTAATCSNTYCHGNFSKGNAATNHPNWTIVDGSQSQCGSCHGTPPPASTGHPQSSSDVKTCNKCHPATVSPAGTINISAGTHINGVSDTTALACSTCHGDASRLPTADPNRLAAPPVDTSGDSGVDFRGVGAHEAHLNSSPMHRTVQCAECHSTVATYTNTAAGTHQNSVGDISFSGVGALRDGGSPAPAYNRTAMTCSNVYCHGATLLGPASGGVINRTPNWVAGGSFNCGTCHALPPAAPHPQSPNCSDCHTNVDSTQRGFIDPQLHINGVVDVANMNCNSCHGNAAGNASLDTARAPPKSTTNVNVTTDLGVGAHQRHLTASTVSGPFPCVSCHLVPVNVGDPGHTDTALPAEVIFSGLASAGGATPVWNRSAATCAGSYCHGATISGGTNLTPSWVAVSNAPLGCTACHGAPPPAPHVQQTDCFTCHDLTATDAGLVNVAAGTHINGVIDVSGASCTACHGTNGVNNAPPRGLAGQTLTTQPAVGAHQKHMVGGAWHVAVTCDGCHVVPKGPGDGGVHQNGITNFSFDGGASYNGTAHTCSNSYCHGSGLQPAKAGGAVIRSPLWTQVDGTQSACGTSCHTNPPGGTHVQVPTTMCVVCHGAVVDSSLNIINASLHINNVKNFTTPTCSGCHGTSANAAPPLDLAGNSSFTVLTVGAHQSHLQDNNVRKAIACTECHIVPVDAGDPGHIDPSPAEVVFGTLAKTGNLTPTWNRTAATCSNVYCHGANIAGGTEIKVPLWTKVDGTQAAVGAGCGTACHMYPPPAPHEQGNNSCEMCHAGTVGRTDAGVVYIKTDGGLHINGNIEATGSHPQPEWDTPDSGNFHGDAFNNGTYTACVSCHGPTLTGGSAPTCETAGCHPGWKTNCTFCHGGTNNTTGAPPTNLLGQTATTLLTVGAHTSHLGATHALSNPVPCTVCHVVPADALSPNHIYLNLSAGTIDPRPAEVRFAGLGAIGDGGVPTYATNTCVTYCHGSFLWGNLANRPTWTDANSTTARACTSCHTLALLSSRHRTPADHIQTCNYCHNAVTNNASNGASISSPALHINGVKDVAFPFAGTFNSSTKGCGVVCHCTLDGGAGGCNMSHAINNEMWR